MRRRPVVSGWYPGFRKFFLGRLMPTLLIYQFFTFSLVLHASTSLPGDSSPSLVGNGPTFRVGLLEKVVDFPVDWVAGGGGVLAYGAGSKAYFGTEANPDVILASLTLDHAVSEGVILGKYAVLSHEGIGLRIIDVEDPAQPVDLGVHGLAGTTFHLASRGNFIYVGEEGRGIRILEIGDSKDKDSSAFAGSLLVERGFIHVLVPIEAIAVGANGTAYVATDNELRAYDVSDPSRTVETGSLPLTGAVNSMAVQGDQLLIAAGAQGLSVIDVSSPGTPASSIHHEFSSKSLYLAGRAGYSAAGTEGLSLVHAGPMAATTYDVLVMNFQFMPATITIYPGDTVRWVWMDGGHSTTSGRACTPDGLWDSGVHGIGFTFERTFDTTGTFDYFSSPFCARGMVGTVQVVQLPATPAITIDPLSIDFGSVTVGQISDPQTITIQNSLDSLEVLTGTVGSLSTPFSVVSGEGSFNLVPGESTSVVVRFLPLLEATFSAGLSITHNAGNRTSPITVSLSGAGVTAATVNLSVDPKTLDFGNVGTGQSVEQTVVLTNQGSSTANLTGTVGTPSSPFSVASGGGTFNLSPGQSKSVVVRFSPTATGSFSGDFRISHNATNQASPVKVSLKGTGVTTTVGISISSTAVSFGTVGLGQSVSETITISNPSSSTGTLTGTVGNLASPFSVPSGQGSFSLTPGQARSVEVRFSPTAAGSFSGTLSITHNASNQPSPATISVTGTSEVLPPPNPVINITVSTRSLDFRSVVAGEFSRKALTIKNERNSTGSLSVSVGNLSAPFAIVSGGGGYSLSPGQSQSVLVQFLPMAPGTFATSFQIIHNGTNQGSPISISVTGTGVPATVNISITPTSVDFGTVSVGQPVDRTVNIANSGNSTGSLTGAVGSLQAPFSVVSGAGPFSLSRGQSKSVVVRFSPAQAGTFSGTLSVEHNGGNQGSPATVSVTGTSVVPGKPDLIIPTIAGPATGKAGKKISVSLSVKNQGTATAEGTCWAGIYLSRDQQIGPDDRLLGRTPVGSLGIGAFYGPVSVEATVPRDVSPGQYYIGAMVDMAGQVDELDKTNNAGFDRAGIYICGKLTKPKLLSPANRAKDVSTTPLLDWSDVVGANQYEIQVALDSRFQNVVRAKSDLRESQWALTEPLDGSTTYFWRVRAVDPCGSGPWSSTRKIGTAPIL